MKGVGLDIKLMCKTMDLNLSQCLRLYTHISISVSIIVGNRSNKDASVGLIIIGWQCSILVLWEVCLHLVFFTKLRYVVMFQIFVEFLSMM